MTYKDLVLTLLKTRDDLVCMEDHIMNDFQGIPDPQKGFGEWCKAHNLNYARVKEGSLTKICLTKVGVKVDMCTS